jgi:hypothetical protein
VKLLVLANPESNRVALFQAALAKQGEPPAQVVGWLDLLRDPTVLEGPPDEPLLFRIDSAGKSFAVERELLRAGGFEAADRLVEQRGLITAPRRAHEGFLRTLERIDALLARKPSWVALNPPREIAELFDKRLTSRRYRALGVPVPEPLDGIQSRAALDAAMAGRGWDRVFVKLSCGSSAGCLAVYSGDTLHTTIEQTAGGWFNTRKVELVRDSRRIDELLAFLLGEGSQVEHAVPKARLDNAFFDCRVLCISGEPTFVVVRQNRHPITNIHLGGWRGDVTRLRALVPPDAWAAAMRSCATVAGCYRALHVGIDLLFEPGLERHRILEANAFGDLFPGLERDGMSIYEWEIRAARSRIPSPKT